MNRKTITAMFLTILFGLTTHVSAAILVDDFESYTSDADLQTIWEWTGIIVGDQTTNSLSTTGGSDGDQAMQVVFTFSTGDRDPWGYTGGYVNNGNPEDWSGSDSLRVWLQASETGNTPQYIQLALHEGNGGSGDWGDKFHSVNIYISDLNLAGEYVSLAFSDFVDYGGFGGTRDNGTLELDDIRSIFVFSKYDGTANKSSSASILVDDVIVVGGSLPPVRYPYLQNVTQTSVNVMWGSYESTGQVFWGNTSGSYPNSASSAAFQDNDGVYIHTATIFGLAAGETVYYYVQNGSENIGYNDPTYYAVATPANDASFRMIVYSDTQGKDSWTPKTRHDIVIDAMLPHNPDVVLHCGDMADTGTLPQFNDYFFTHAAPLLKNTNMFHTIGNHELPWNPVTPIDYDRDIKNYRDLFDNPTVNSGTEDYYSVDYGSVHIVSLNTQWLNGDYEDDVAAADMKTWLENDLAASNQPWKMVFFHKPAFLDFVEPQGWSKIFEDNGVQVVYYGHIHNYYSNYRNGVTYITTAGGGGELGEIAWWGWSADYLGGFRDYHFTQVDVTSDKLYIKVFNENDVLRQSFELDTAGNISNIISTPPLGDVDDFENFANDNDFQGTWLWYGGDNGGTLERYLDTGGASGSSNVMRMEFSFPERTADAFGYCGLGGLWKWGNYTGIKLWVKASESGATPQYFDIRLVEGSEGDKWIYSIPIANLDPNGGYISANFSEFVRYGDTGDGVMDLDRIVSFFVGASFSGRTSRLSGAATIYVDDITGISSAPKTVGPDVPATPLPEQFVLHGNYPNPFNPVTTFSYDIPEESFVTLTIYDVLGNEITRLVNENQKADFHHVQWGGKNRIGEQV
ncbi:MAG: hypothetical protein GWO85_00360, partial [Simkaniaceae bacterium]|nr:hypothetical protein [Simkaniaceae bacterium]